MPQLIATVVVGIIVGLCALGVYAAQHMLRHPKHNEEHHEPIWKRHPSELALLTASILITVLVLWLTWPERITWNQVIPFLFGFIAIYCSPETRNEGGH